MDHSVAKPETRSYSCYSRDALLLLAQLIRSARIERKLTAQELADRVGVSRGLLHRIERGDPGCAIGAVFETAAMVGVRLFDADHTEIEAQLSTGRGTLTLLPKAVRCPVGKVEDF